MGRIFYKYCDANGLKILEDLQIKITRPNEFNDPFELSPRFGKDLTPEETLAKFLNKKWIDDQFAQMNRNGGPLEALKMMCHPTQHSPGLLHHLFAQMLSAGARSETISTLQRLSESFGVLCLSRIFDSVLMWSHYADRHRGIIIGFDAEMFPQRFYPVDYSTDRFAIDACIYLETDASEEEVKAIWLRKSKQWDYEQEIRGIFRLDQLVQQKLNNGNLGYFWKIKPEMIVDVKLGCHCAPDFERSVKRAIRENGLTRASLERACLNPDVYALDFCPI